MLVRSRRICDGGGHLSSEPVIACERDGELGGAWVESDELAVRLFSFFRTICISISVSFRSDIVDELRGRTPKAIVLPGDRRFRLYFGTVLGLGVLK